MKRFIRKITLSVLFAAGSIFASGAAMAGGDVYSHPSIWSGFYAGGHLGYAFVDHGADFGEDKKGGDEECVKWRYSRKYKKLICKKVLGYNYNYKTDNDGDGFVGGAHVGYNFQKGKFVFGIEGDYSATTSDIGASLDGNVYVSGKHGTYEILNASAKYEVEMDYLASIRARAGYASDKYLLYVTGGIAWTQLEESFNVSGQFLGENFSGGFSNTENLTGFVVGGGGEYMLGDGLSIRGEVLHYEFDDKGIDFNSTVVRTGVSLHLN